MALYQRKIVGDRKRARESWQKKKVKKKNLPVTMTESSAKASKGREQLRFIVAVVVVKQTRKNR